MIMFSNFDFYDRNRQQLLPENRLACLTLIPMAQFPTDSLWGWVINVPAMIMTLQVFKICFNYIDSSVAKHWSADH